MKIVKRRGTGTSEVLLGFPYVFCLFTVYLTATSVVESTQRPTDGWLTS
jgi:hypothetical protein